MINFYENGRTIEGEGGVYHIKGKNPTISSEMIGHPDLIKEREDGRA